MNLLFSFLAGLGVTLGAVLLPGMLNMSVLRTCVRCGRRAALVYAAGICSIIAVQATIGVIGARYLSISQNLIESLEVYAIPVFISLAAFFFYRGYRKHFAETEEEEAEEETDSVREDRQFIDGLTISGMNVLAIPYYYALSGWLFGGGYLEPSLMARSLFVVGVTLGCFACFSVYAYGANWIRANVRTVTANINFIMGGIITLGVVIHSVRTFLSE